MKQPRDFERLWRRVIGLGGFVLFLLGFMVAIDLEELVVLALGLGGLCALAGGTTWLLARYRRQLVDGGIGAYRAAAPVVAGVSRRAGAGSRGAARRAVPVLRRADEQLGARLNTVLSAGRRHAGRALASVAADIHSHRAGARSASARAQSRRPGSRPAPARSPAAGPPTGRRRERDRSRDRA